MNNQATTQNNIQSKSLDTQLAEFRNRRFLAMPLAGTIIWSLLILTGALLPPTLAVWAVFIGTGSIVYLALGLSKLTGESMKFQKGSERNFFDTVFLSAVGMSFLVYALAIPFFLQDYRSLPFTVAVLAGIMWLPVSVLLQHWIGVFHGVVRTVLCTAAWVIAPEHSFVLQPVIVVAVYLVSIVALEQRWRTMQAEVGTVSADCTFRQYLIYNKCLFCLPDSHSDWRVWLLEQAMTDLKQAVATQLANIEQRTGKSLSELTQIINNSGLSKHGELVTMLKTSLGMGHGDANTLVHTVRQTDGQSAAEGLNELQVLDGLYTGAKAALRPIHDALLAEIQQFGEFEASPKKTYVSYRRNKQFAMIGPATNSQLEVGLNIKQLPEDPRLKALPAGQMCNFKVRLSNVSEVDAQLLGWIQTAYAAAG